MIQTLLGSDANLASLLLRIAAGIIFVAHGYPKLGSQRKMGADFVKSSGMPVWMGASAGVGEFFGGLSLIRRLLKPLVPLLFVFWLILSNILTKAELKTHVQC